MAQGAPLLAIRNNALLVIGTPLLLWEINRQRKRVEFDPQSTSRLFWTILIVIVVFFIGRNLPSPALSPFAPIEISENSP